MSVGAKLKRQLVGLDSHSKMQRNICFRYMKVGKRWHNREKQKSEGLGLAEIVKGCGRKDFRRTTDSHADYVIYDW